MVDCAVLGAESRQNGLSLWWGQRKQRREATDLWMSGVVPAHLGLAFGMHGYKGMVSLIPLYQIIRLTTGSGNCSANAFMFKRTK